MDASSEKSANTQPPVNKAYSETETREGIIDPMLCKAGWNPKAENVEEYAVRGMPTDTGQGKVDYVLWGKDGKPLALIEAKRTRKDAEAGKRQAELYADCLEQMHAQRPLIYYSNGYSTWLWDDQFYPPREVQGFATQDELQWRIHQRSSREDLSRMQPKAEIAGRYYQREAAARVMENFGTRRKRKSLIVMATGSGKTRLAIALVDMLMRAKRVRKVLFLADRRALVKQAKRAFKAHLPHVSVARLLDKSQEEARVLFATYPAMLNCIDGTRPYLKETFSVAHFDLVIIDEAHRSVYQKYGAIFEYFDALLLGLTATPRGEVDRNTYRLFELDDHQPTYAYELEQAVADGFLVPPKAISVPLKFQREGIKYKALSPKEQDEYELQEQFYDQDSGELKEEISASALNQWLFNVDTIDKVLMHLMTNGIKVEGGDTLGKTIIFAKKTKHADFIVKQFDKHYPQIAGKFCRKIDFSVGDAQSLIDDFSIKEKMPQIAVSVDMLDTGIDVPEVVNLVFFKLVRSRTKFWQMIGRGTRLCENLFAPGEHKKEFIVFDYCQNLEFFDANPEGYDAPAQESLKQKIFKRRLALAVVLQNGQAPGHETDPGTKQFSSRLKDQLHDVINRMNLDNFIVRKQRKTVETFTRRERWANLSDEDVVTIAKKLSNLPSADDDDEYARRFDLLILNLQIALLQNNSSQENDSLKLRALAGALESKSAIPGVAAQMALILDLQRDSWWMDVRLPILEDVRIKLRKLARFIDPEAGLYDVVVTHFEDTLLAEESSEYQIVKNDPKLKDYRRRVQRYIREHQDHLTIRRLKQNEPVTQTDIAALEDILFSNDGAMPRDEYEKVFGEKPLGVLVRSVVGLSRNAAKAAFADFLAEAPLHPDQITFLDTVVEYLVKNGTMEPKRMFEAPFTRSNSQGVAGIFGDNQSKKLIQLVRHINRNANAA